MLGMNFRVNIKSLEKAANFLGYPQFWLKNSDKLPVAPGYQRRMTEPQANPPPIASVTIRSPCLIWPLDAPTLSASGIEAAEVFP